MDGTSIPFEIAGLIGIGAIVFIAYVLPRLIGLSERRYEREREKDPDSGLNRTSKLLPGTESPEMYALLRGIPEERDNFPLEQQQRRNRHDRRRKNR